MNRSKWLNRGTALGLLTGALLGAGTSFAASKLRERQKEMNTEPVNDPATIILDYEKQRAHRGCVALISAIETYVVSPHNPARDLPDEQKFPSRLWDLVEVPFGGPSFLRSGPGGLVSPWEKRYEMERLRKSDGTVFILVTTTAPDGTPISQFGIGPNARPRP